MKALKVILAITLLLLDQRSFSQLTVLTLPPNGGNKRASISEVIGITSITIHYDRPGVKGREGKIFGTNVVPYGLNDLGLGSAKQAPWRAGANENTTFECSTDVRIEGKELHAGKYGFFVLMQEQEATIIFSKNAHSWGSFYYDPKDDALRVTVKLVKLPLSMEWLKFDFSDETDSSATVSLNWEKVRIPFTVAVDYVKTQIESFRNELQYSQGLSPDAWAQAAQFCADHNTNLDEALTWADNAVAGAVVGQKTFITLSAKAGVLEKLGRQPEADQIMKEALPLGDMVQVHIYGRQLIAAGQPREALKIFQMNYGKHPNELIPLVGLARGFSAVGDYQNALKYARLALPLSGRQGGQRAVIETMITKLEAGKDGN
jgi:tetratricopeptide (TPR) repeat protein